MELKGGSAAGVVAIARPVEHDGGSDHDGHLLCQPEDVITAQRETDDANGLTPRAGNCVQMLCRPGDLLRDRLLLEFRPELLSFFDGCSR